MDLIAFIQSHHLHLLSYVVLFFGTFLDANLAIFTGVFLVLRRVLSALVVAPVLLAGVCSEQLFWYGVGRLLGKHEKILRWTNKATARFDRHFHERPFRTLLISKFVYGTHRPSLMRAGMLKMPLKKFVIAAFPGGAIWAMAIAGLSAALGASYSLLKIYLRDASLVVLGLIIILVLFEFVMSRRLQKEL